MKCNQAVKYHENHKLQEKDMLKRLCSMLKSSRFKQLSTMSPNQSQTNALLQVSNSSLKIILRVFKNTYFRLIISQNYPRSRY